MSEFLRTHVMIYAISSQKKQTFTESIEIAWYIATFR